MRAKTVNENVSFKRGIPAKDSLSIGIERFRIEYKKSLLSSLDYYKNQWEDVTSRISRTLGLPSNEIYYIESSEYREPDRIQALRTLESESTEYLSDETGALYDDTGSRLDISLLFFKTKYGNMAKTIDYEPFGNGEPEEEWYGDIRLKHFIKQMPEEDKY